MGYRLGIGSSPGAPGPHPFRIAVLDVASAAVGSPDVEDVGAVDAKIERNLVRERDSVRGSVHLHNLDHWTELVERRDVLGLHRVMTGLDRGSVEMREVSPMGGLLPEHERIDVMKDLGEISAPVR